jgi:hypothetical protein
MALCFQIMRASVLIALLSVAGVARADEAPRSIWLECKAPAVWPLRSAAPVRLTCRVDAGGPAFWQTVNPFTVERASELLDPFAVDVTPHYLDVFENGRYARPRSARPAPPARKVDAADDLISPFEVYPDTSETLNPFVPPAGGADPSAR